MGFWPFRTGNDDRFQTSSKEETIYDALQGQMPPHRYEVELMNYMEWRWQRGFVQSVFPVTCYSALAGLLVGFRQSRVEGRYIGRYKVMWRYTSTFAAVGLLTTGFHHVLVMRNEYKDKFYYPILSGVLGSVVLTLAAEMGSMGQGVFAGSMVGILYFFGCYGMDYYRRRHMRLFLEQQQLQLVPIHKVSPEFQPMYRAFLYDNRPLEESNLRSREAALLVRSMDDTRLDAVTMKNNMFPEVYSWVNFPDWWPLKWPIQSEEEEVLLERQRDEEIQRRKAVFLQVEDGHMLKRRNRSKHYRDE